MRQKCPNTGKYGPEISPFLHTFHEVSLSKQLSITACNNYFSLGSEFRDFNCRFCKTFASFLNFFAKIF